MITNRDSLISNVYTWMIRDQATDSFLNTDLIQTYIQLCESELNRELKTIDVEDTESYTLSTVNDYIELPSDYRGVVAFQYDGRPYDIEWFPNRRAMLEKYTTTSQRPKAYFIQGSRIYFNCVPDDEYEMTLDYYKGVVGLTSSNPTNVILTKFPDLYLYGTIRQACINLNQTSRLEKVAPLYADIISRIKEDDKNGRIPVAAVMKPRSTIG